MRITRFLIAIALATHAILPITARSEGVKPVQFIVNSQVISDEVVSGGESYNSDSIAADASVLPDGSTVDGVYDGSNSGAGLGRGVLGNGALRGRLAGTAAYVGDLRHGVYANELTTGCVPRTYGYPDLFYNYYTQGYCNGTNAQMYLSPVPVPPNVGHTFYTYQPFMPQEMLYWHKDRFHNYYDGGRGMNHTKVHYFAPPIRQTASTFYWNHIRIPR